MLLQFLREWVIIDTRRNPYEADIYGNGHDLRGMRGAAKLRTQVNSILTLEALEETLSAFMLTRE